MKGTISGGGEAEEVNEYSIISANITNVFPLLPQYSYAILPCHLQAESMSQKYD
jgi:hypothetical protein